MKKIAVMACCIAIVLAVAISGVIAFFTDTDKDINVFTVGNVVIELIEQQRNGSGGYESFVNDKKLMPMLTPSEFDSDGLPTAKEFQDKIIRVKNIGKSAAYVRVFVGVPAELDNKGALHLVDGSGFNSTKGFSGYSMTGPIMGQIVGGETYNFYCYTFDGVLPVNQTTGAAIVGVYLDESVDFNSADGKFYIGSKKDPNNQLTANLDNPVNIPVYAQAVQIEGFSTPSGAFGAAFTQFPWGGATASSATPSSEPEDHASELPVAPVEGPAID